MSKELINYRGKVLLITGASTGIGKATAIAFAQQGAKLAIADINEDAAASTLEEVKKYSPESIFITTDVSNEEQVKVMVERTVSTFGVIDCAFNNAGILHTLATIENFDIEVYEKIMSVNARGVLLCMKYQLKHMIPNKRGAILNTSSVGGLYPEGGMAAYVAGKHAVIGLTKTAAIETAGLGIRVNALAPGWVRTPMTKGWDEDKEFNEKLRAAVPTHRGAEPSEIASMVLYLLSDAASYCTGQTYLVDGAQTSKGVLPFER